MSVALNSFVHRQLGDILTSQGVLTTEALDAGLEAQGERGGRLGEVLIDMEAITETDLARALAEQMELEFCEEIDAETIDPKLVSSMSLTYVLSHDMLPLDDVEVRARVAVVVPLTTFALDDMRVLLNREIEMVVVPSATLNSAMHRVFDRRAGADQVVGDLNEEELGNIAHDLEEQTKDILDEDDEAPIIRLVNSILNQAIKERASDIHIEPYERDIVVRFRKDGVLKEIVRARSASKRLSPAGSRSWGTSTSPKSACRKTVVSGSKSPDGMWTCAYRPCPRHSRADRPAYPR